MLPQVLLVDDEEALLAAFTRAYRGRYAVTTALSGREGLAVIQASKPFAVVVADMRMPGMNGIEFLQQVAALSPDTSRIMLTGVADQETAIQAVNMGRVFRFLNKPCDEDSLAASIDAGVSQYRLVTSERILLEQTLSGSIQTMVDLLSVYDPKGFGRAQMVRDYAFRICTAMGLDAAWDLGVAALLAQIGTLAIPLEVQNRALQWDRITAQERDLFWKVPEIGARLLGQIPRLQSVARFILYSQKDFDGHGYPVDGVHGKDLPVESRVLKVASDFVRLVQTRKSAVVVVAQMKLDIGKYDPGIVAALDRVIQKTPSGSPEPTQVLLPVQDLRAGMVLASDALSDEGLVMLATGTRLSPIHIEKLHNLANMRGVQEPLLVTPFDQMA